MRTERAREIAEEEWPNSAFDHEAFAVKVALRFAAEQVAERDSLLEEAAEEIESLIGCLDRSLIVATGQPGNARALLAKIRALKGVK